MDFLVWILWSSPKVSLQTGFQGVAAEPREPYFGRPETARSPTLHHILSTNLSLSLFRKMGFVDTDWKGPWPVSSCWSQMSTEAIARLASSTLRELFLPLFFQAQDPESPLSRFLEASGRTFSTMPAFMGITCNFSSFLHFECVSCFQDHGYTLPCSCFCSNTS